jgi:hypothetical protein
MITTAAVLVPCDRCGKHILACRVSGFRAYADPQPLTIAAEITARMNDASLYDVLTRGLPKQLYLEYRDLTRVICGRSYPVVAAHCCASGRRPGNPVNGDPLAYPFHRPEKKRAVMVNGDDDEIPF